MNNAKFFCPQRARAGLVAALLLVIAFPGMADDDSWVIFDFEDGILPDRAWLRNQPEGAHTFVGPYPGRADFRLSIDEGAGRNGGNALLIESDQVEGRNPGLWVYRMRPGGGRVRGSDKYLLPAGRRANRLSFWIRFDPGYQKERAGVMPPRYPNHQNMDVGTYHTRNLSDSSVESDNWHFYHQLWVRHDKADGDWIYVEINEAPTHQRSWGTMTPPVNPTQPYGNYWELATRFYIGGGAADPEIGPPVRMWVDDIRFSYVAPQMPVEVQFEGYATGDTVDSSGDLPFVVTNHGDKQLCGVVWAQSFYANRPNYHDLQRYYGAMGEEVCLQPGVSRRYPFSLGGTEGRYAVAGFTADRYRNASDSAVNVSLSSPYVERRWNAELGVNDAELPATFIRYRPVSGSKQD